MSLTSWLLPKAKTLVGVDIGTSSVKVAEVRAAGGGKYELQALGMQNLPADSIVDGVIISKLAVADAIDQLFRTHNIRNDKIATSICGHSVIVKKVSLPAQSDRELEESIQWEAEQYIPFDISEVNLDYQVLRRGGQGNRMEVLLVAAKRDKISDHTSVLSMAGKKPLVVDIDAFALQTAFEVNYQPDNQTVVALLDIGATMIKVNLVKGKEFLFTRDIAMGGNHYTEYLQRELSIPFEEAERYKTGETPTPEISERTGEILEEVSEILTLEVQKTFDFFKTTSESVEIREVYLSGGASRTHGLRDYLQKKLELPVQFLNPLKQLKIKAGGIDPDLSEELATDFAIAIGLALRSERDRRVNLLREPAQKTKRQMVPQSKWAAGFAGVLLLEALVLGGWYHILGSTVAEQRTEIQSLQQEQTRLKALQEQLQRFQQQKQELDRRLNVVRRLQENKQGPVNLMNAVVQSVPDAPNLWLTSLTQRGSALTIEGKAFAVDPIAEFMARLTGRKPVKDVELDFWEREEGLVKFKLTCTLEN